VQICQHGMSCMYRLQSYKVLRICVSLLQRQYKLFVCHRPLETALTSLELQKLYVVMSLCVDDDIDVENTQAHANASMPASQIQLNQCYYINSSKHVNFGFQFREFQLCNHTQCPGIGRIYRGEI